MMPNHLSLYLVIFSPSKMSSIFWYSSLNVSLHLASLNLSLSYHLLHLHLLSLFIYAVIHGTSNHLLWLFVFLFGIILIYSMFFSPPCCLFDILIHIIFPLYLSFPLPYLLSFFSSFTFWNIF